MRLRRTKIQIAQFEARIVEILERDLPLSVRHIYYRLTEFPWPEGVTKTDNGYDQVVDRMTNLRRSGRVPYSWVTDSTRQGYFTPTYASAADFLRRVNGAYRADPWRKADTYVEVWCESRSIAGVIEGICR